MIKQVKLSASGTPAPTGYKLMKRVAPEPRDSTKPVTASSAPTVSNGNGSTSGVHKNAPKQRPHILQGWRTR